MYIIFDLLEKYNTIFLLKICFYSCKFIMKILRHFIKIYRLLTSDVRNFIYIKF